MSACYKMYSIVQRVYPLTVDSLLNPGTLSIAFVILINYNAPKISNENSTYTCLSKTTFLFGFISFYGSLSVDRLTDAIVQRTYNMNIRHIIYHIKTMPILNRFVSDTININSFSCGYKIILVFG